MYIQCIPVGLIAEPLPFGYLGQLQPADQLYFVEESLLSSGYLVGRILDSVSLA